MNILKISLVAVTVLVASEFSRAQDAKDRATAVKASLATSQSLLRQYEWIETTVVSIKGDEKSRTVNRCYYGEDGKVQKVPAVAPPKEEPKRGLRGKIAEKKKEEMTEYMHEAVALVKSYMPLDSARLHAAQEAGRLTLQPFPGGNPVRLTFAEYQKKNDSVGVDLDTKTNRLTGARIATVMESDKEPVTVAVRFDTLHDTIVYPAQITLEAKGKNLTVSIENSGYRKVAR